MKTALENFQHVVAENGGQDAADQQRPISDVSPRPPAPQELACLLKQIADILNTYVELPSKRFGVLIALWIANTYIYQLFDSCGYLRFKSATPGVESRGCWN